MVDSIGIVQLAVNPAPVLSAPSSGNTTPATLPSFAPVLPAATVDQVTISPQAQQQPVVQPKVQIANPQILGDTAVTMYQVNGQLYTRYRDEKTGQVTYVPKEAQVISAGDSGSGVSPSVNITA